MSPKERDPKREALKRDEKEIGKNAPAEMIGLDSADAADVESAR